MSTTPHGFRTPESLAEDADRAVNILRTYYARVHGSNGFTGSLFDTFDPRGTRAADADTFTSDDLVAVTLLSVTVPARAALEILGPRRPELEALLSELGPDRDLVDEPSVDQDAFATAWTLNAALRDIYGIGATTTSKLLARKRPRLFPIFDTVVDRYALGGSGVLWEPLHTALGANERALHRQLVHVRQAAELPASVSPLRVLDVLTWMEGTGRVPAPDAGTGTHDSA